MEHANYHAGSREHLVHEDNNIRVL